MWMLFRHDQTPYIWEPTSSHLNLNITSSCGDILNRNIKGLILWLWLWFLINIFRLNFLHEYECYLDVAIKLITHKNLLLDTKTIEISQAVKEICWIAISRARFYDFMTFVDILKLMALHAYECYLDIIIKVLIYENLPLHTKNFEISHIVLEICWFAISKARFSDFGCEYL